MDLGAVGYPECIVTDHGDHRLLCKGVHELLIFQIFLLSYEHVREAGRLRQLFKIVHVVHALHFHAETQYEIFDHGVVKFSDMGVFEFLKTQKCTEAQSFRTPDTHAVIRADDHLGNADADGRSVLRFAFDREETVQTSNEPVRDGKAEAEAVCRSGLSRIGLIEALEYHFQFRAAHADSRIRHFQEQIDSVVPFLRCDMDIYASLFRVLEGVVDQMPEYFFELGHIGPHSGRDVGIHIDDEFEIRSLERSDFSNDIMEQGSDHIIFFVYRKRVHVDLGIVQDIADLIPDFLPCFHDGQKILLYIFVLDFIGTDP